MAVAYFDDQIFEKKDFSDVSILRGEYEGCTFKSCNFANVNLSDFRFIDSEFIECNFSNVQINNTSFQDVIFKTCKMLGLRFETCNTLGFAANFNHCNLDHSTFYQMKLSRTVFLNSQLHGVDFSQAILKNTSITTCDLLNAQFENTNLEKTDFRQSKNYAIHPELNNIKGAKFTLPDVVGLLEAYKIKISH